MKILILLLFLVSCASSKYKAGDCFSLRKSHSGGHQHLLKITKVTEKKYYILEYCESSEPAGGAYGAEVPQDVFNKTVKMAFEPSDYCKKKGL